MPEGAYISELFNLLGADNVSVKLQQRLAHSVDASWIAKYRVHNDLPVPMPDVVVWPTTAADVAEVIGIASRHVVPVVARGGGSGIQGGTLAMAGGIGVDLTRLNGILNIDTYNLSATVEAGVTGPELQQALEPFGLMCSHDPGSFWRGATVGGWVAARGAGVTSTKYGKAEDVIVGMQVAIPPGTLIETLGMPSHAVGPGLLPLFVGAEGVLGITTQVTLRLDPIPQTQQFLTFAFATLENGLEACRQIMTSRVRVSVMRLYDPAAARSLTGNIGETAEGVLLLVVCDGDPRLVGVEATMVRDLCKQCDGKDLGSGLCETWWQNRYLPHSVEHSPKPPLVYGTTDVCAPFGSLEEIYETRKRLLAERFADANVRYTAHFSHWYPMGGMIYDRFYVDNPPASATAAIALHREIWDALMDESVLGDAVLNDHHGVGRQLHRYVAAHYGNAFAVLESVKQAIDPLGIMNPGKLGFQQPRGAVATADEYEGL
jgi:alkyldihydroxyacetonephosphate synthase